MAPLVLDPPTGTPTSRSETRVLTGEVRVLGGAGPTSATITWGDGADVVPVEEHRDIEFEREKQSFRAIPPFTLGRYRGLFVASRGGQIVDSDPDLSVLVNRFFTKHGNVPVYITKVGPDQDEFRIDTPFFE